MKKTFLLFGLLAFFILLSDSRVLGASIFQPFQGGTGSSTLSGIIIGNGTSPVNTLTIGSNLTLTGTTLSSSGGGGTGVGTVATSALETAGFLPYYTSTSAYPALVGKVATGTLSGSGGVTVTAGTSIIGANSTIACATCALFGWPWVTTTNYGTTTSSTTTMPWFVQGLQASSTSYLVFASSTALTATSLCLTGDVCRTTWPSGTFPFSADNTYNQVVYSTSTPSLWLKSGLFASSTSFFNIVTIDNGSTDTLTLGTQNANQVINFGSSRAQVGFVSATGFALLQGGNNKGVQFAVNNNTFASGIAATITQFGNMGIATVTPFAALEVASTSASGGRQGQLALTDNGAGANLKHWLFSSFNGIFQLGTTTDGYATSTTPALTILNAGSVGLGSSSPFTTLAITGVVGKSPFAISTTSTTAASSTLFMIDQNGDVHHGGGTPVLSSCGTAPVLDANSTDQAGTITVGATTASCTLTFSVAKLSKPHCVVASETGTIAISYTESTTALVVTNATLGGDLVDYFCSLGH